MVFEEHLETFVEGFQKTLQFLGVKTRAYKVDDVRRAYPKAYERWSTDEDEELKVKYQHGVSVSELATYFQRQPSAIRSRLAKLGLLPAQDKISNKVACKNVERCPTSAFSETWPSDSPAGERPGLKPGLGKRQNATSAAKGVFCRQGMKHKSGVLPPGDAFLYGLPLFMPGQAQVGSRVWRLAFACI